MTLHAHKARPHRLIRTRIGRAATATATPAADRVVPGTRVMTAEEVTTLVNTGKLTLRTGNALLVSLGIRPVHGNRQITYRVPIAVPVAAHCRPAAAMAHLDTTVSQALERMAWTSAAADPEGYAIDLPSPHDPPGQPGPSLVHADLRLTVTVPAYPPLRLWRMAAELLGRDLGLLRRLGVRVGRPERCENEDPPPDVYAGDYCHPGFYAGPDDLDDDWLD